MLRAHLITAENVDRFHAIYDRFAAKAASDYGWTHEPLAFDALRGKLAVKLIEGLWVEESARETAVGFLLFCREDHRSIEINLIYSEVDERKSFLDCLMRAFLPVVVNDEGWDVISYAMLGEQGSFIRTLPWYGFTPVGQAILAFDIADPLSVQILKQQTAVLPDSSFTLDCWRPEYAGETAQSIFESFSTACDALWDPRFRTLRGARRIMGLIDSGQMGALMAEETVILLQDGVPSGFCFLLQDAMTSAHIPLVGVRPSLKGKGLGKLLLQTCLNRCVDRLLAGENTILKISATTDTDNLAAIHMYRRMGFREEVNYPHAYLPREKARAFKPGQWC